MIVGDEAPDLAGVAVLELDILLLFVSVVITFRRYQSSRLGTEISIM